ncbi:MAG: MFS transporter [Cyanobacteria bacterium J06635_15]
MDSPASYLASKMKVAINKPGSFLIFWLGQTLSQIGSSLTSFALGVWIYKSTGAIIELGFVSFLTALPGVMVSPLAGALVDRWNRRFVLIWSDAGAAANTLIVAILFLSHHLATWNIYLFSVVTSLLGAFQILARGAVVAMMVSQQQLIKANGLMQLSVGIAQIASPALAGFLLLRIQLTGIILADFATFLTAMMTLSIIQIHQENISRNNHQKLSIIDDLSIAWQYLLNQKGLLFLILFLSVYNFILGSISVLVNPLVLSFSNSVFLGNILSIGGLGMLLGGAAISIGGGNSHRIQSLFVFSMLSGFALICSGLKPSIMLIAMSAFLFSVSLSIINSISQTIIQNKATCEMQGRILALSGTITGISLPLGYLAAGLMADYLFEPLLAEKGLLAKSIGSLIGVGPGRGVGLLFISAGILMIIATVVAFCYQPLRCLDDTSMKRDIG